MIESLREFFTHAEIDFLTEKPAAPVIRENPSLNRSWILDKERGSSVQLIRGIRARKYDLVIDLFCNPRSALLTLLSGARYRVGYPFRGRKYAYTIRVPFITKSVHNVEFNLNVLRHLGIPVSPKMPFFPLTAASLGFAETWLRSHAINSKMMVGLNPSGGWSTKRWGLKHYAELGDMIVENYSAVILLLCGPGERNDALEIQTLMKCPSFVVPDTTLTELGAFLQKCSYVVSNDSGPMHISAAVGTPTLGIYGPTNPHHQGPYGEKNRWVRNEELDCLGCNLTACPIGNICMTRLEVDRVFSAFTSLVEESSRISASAAKH